jgi:hypothetical protein
MTYRSRSSALNIYQDFITIFLAKGAKFQRLYACNRWGRRAGKVRDAT